MNKITLTQDQSNALQSITSFINNKTDSVFVLHGSAGTGKTLLTKQIILTNSTKKICCITPTHKAKYVFEENIKPLKTNVNTLASILTKGREHSYIGTKLYSDGTQKKLIEYNLFLLDEVSMVSDNDLTIIINYVKSSGKKIICIGDQYQIPSPSQIIIKLDNYCIKKNSMAFTSSFLSYELKEIVRQKNNIIIDVATQLRNNINDDSILLSKLLQDKNVNILSFSEMSNKYKELYEQEKIHPRCIVYTNKSVQMTNTYIRKFLFNNTTSTDIITTNNTLNETSSIDINSTQKNKFYENEIITAYNNLGYPNYYLHNGMDYIIKNVKYTNTYNVLNNNNLSGYVLELYNNVVKIFVIDVDNTNNNVFLQKLIDLAIKVNSFKSTKNDFITYSNMKNEIVFIEDIYRYDNKNYSKYVFKEIHPLLFTKTSDIIFIDKFTSTIKNKESLVYLKYKNIIDERLLDNKIISDNETLADKFMVIEKDINYGYCITAHKSQGSTYKHVFVLETDFDCIKPRYNKYFKCYENKTLEKNQLKYVAITRATTSVQLYTDLDICINESE